MVKKIGFSIVASSIILTTSLLGVEYGDATQLENKMSSEPLKKSAVRSESIDAQELLDSQLKQNNWQKGWKQGKIIATQCAIRNIDDDPSYNSKFMDIRGMAAVESVLRAKAEIIKAIRSNMSAEDILVGPGSNLDDQLSQELKTVQGKLEDQKRKLIRLLKEENISYNDLQNGVTFKDRLNSFIDAAIKKLDKKYSAEHLLAKKQKKYDTIKKKVDEANNKYKDLDKRIQNLKGTIKQEMTSTRTILASMPIIGASVIYQAESYNEDQEEYQNCVAMLWSNKSEKVARNILIGQDVTVPPGNQTLQEWLEEHSSSDLITMTGGRRFRDKNGDVYFIGIGAQEYDGSASAKRRAMSMAKIEAQTQVAFAMFADVKTQETMSKKEIVRNAGVSKDNTQIATSLQETLSQAFKNMSIQGVSEVFTKKGIHPISQKEVYVSVYAVSAKAAKAAIMAEKSSYASLLMVEDAQQQSKAKKDIYVQAVKKKRLEQKSYKKEYQKSNSVPQTRSYSTNKQDHTTRSTTTTVVTPTPTKTLRSGSYGSKVSDTSLDW